MTITYDNCSLYVLGMDLKCPLCGSLVKSGETHRCSSKPTKKKRGISNASN